MLDLFAPKLTGLLPLFSLPYLINKALKPAWVLLPPFFDDGEVYAAPS